MTTVPHDVEFDDVDFSAVMRLMQVTLRNDKGTISLSREDAKAICRYILRILHTADATVYTVAR